MKRNTIVMSIFFLIVAASCGGRAMEETGSAADSASGQNQMAQLNQMPKNDLYSDGKASLIKTVNYRFEVDNVKRTTDAIIQSIRKYPAYVSSSSLHLENPLLENKMAIRIQNEYFNDLLQEIDLQARFVNYRDVSTQDVSKDFVDLESRLKTKREVEARYMEILRKKAGTIEELMNAEQQIGELHEEIEATISRINFLKDQVSYSTINLEFYQTISQEIKASSGPGIGEKFGAALAAGWNGLVNMAIAVTYLWPLIIVAAGAMTFLRLRVVRKRKSAVIN
jgi:DNA repair exonuclease SbcCD ATPase subunit